MSAAEYLAEHEAIRAKILAESYAVIENPMAAVDFMINGLQHNPTMQPIGMLLYKAKLKDPYEFSQCLTGLLWFPPYGYTGLLPAHPSPQDTTVHELYEIFKKLCAMQSPAKPTRPKFKPYQHYIDLDTPPRRNLDEKFHDVNHLKNKKTNAVSKHAKVDYTALRSKSTTS